ncbi:MAG TPA: hypothetical protein VLA12_07970 [Planctomycetaceae bacterium]|nr:hypothetical protein [Planctomycetaceae bacterium]
MKYLLAVLVAIPWIVLGLIEFQAHRAQRRDQAQRAEQVMKIQEVWQAVTHSPAETEQKSEASTHRKPVYGTVLPVEPKEFPETGVRLYQVETDEAGTVAVHTTKALFQGMLVQVVEETTIGGDNQPTEIYWAKDVDPEVEKVWRQMNPEQSPP